jgi:hypothetical protein
VAELKRNPLPNGGEQYRSKVTAEDMAARRALAEELLGKGKAFPKVGEGK